ncbi:hypothetical protein BX600DRAFT_446118 [Xylariales sp. PMI_506]|nr:hypothetical protein BX600DRAFT_446118 [Xylariales sp. PMI_506]
MVRCQGVWLFTERTPGTSTGRGHFISSFIVARLATNMTTSIARLITLVHAYTPLDSGIPSPVKLSVVVTEGVFRCLQTLAVCPPRCLQGGDILTASRRLLPHRSPRSRLVLVKTVGHLRPSSTSIFTKMALGATSHRPRALGGIASWPIRILRRCLFPLNSSWLVSSYLFLGCVIGLLRLNLAT